MAMPSRLEVCRVSVTGKGQRVHTASVSLLPILQSYVGIWTFLFHFVWIFYALINSCFVAIKFSDSVDAAKVEKKNKVTCSWTHVVSMSKETSEHRMLSQQVQETFLFWSANKKRQWKCDFNKLSLTSLSMFNSPPLLHDSRPLWQTVKN